MATSRHRFSLRLDEGMFERTERQAGARGINRYIVELLRRDLDRREKPPADLVRRFRRLEGRQGGSLVR